MNEFTTFLTESGMTLTDLNKKYNIPLRTLQHWRAGDRRCPEYVLKMLQRIIDLESE